MGRQTYLHALPADREAFLEFVRRHFPIVLTEMCSAEAHIQPVDVLEPERSQTLCMWHQGLLSKLQRSFIPESIEGPYYRIDDLNLPVLEFTTSFRTVWEGKPALGQGRIYGVFKGKPEAFEKWYQTLVRWLRKNFLRSPHFGGYIGPAAHKFYYEGGILLPFFRPPGSKEWLAEIGKQLHQKA